MYYESRKKSNVYFWIVLVIIITVFLNIPAVRNRKPLRGIRTVASNIMFPFKYAGSAIYKKTTSGIVPAR